MKSINIILKKCMINKAFLFYVLLVFTKFAVAQEKTPVAFGKVSISDFTIPKSNVIDSNAGAVIIADVGNVRFIGNNTGWVSYVYKKQTRIKIINKNALDQATIVVDLRVNGKDQEIIDSLNAVSYNIENGKVVETKLDKKDIFTDKYNGYNNLKKFTIPGAKEGSIIEYSYTITSDFDYHLPQWRFQNAIYPCLWSEYEVNIPSLNTYTVFRQGYHRFYIDQSGEGVKNFYIKHTADYGTLSSGENTYTVAAKIAKHRWVMKDVPAFGIESYVSTPENYIDKIEFQLSKIFNGESSTDVDNTWQTATERLSRRSNFGVPIQEGYFSGSKESDKIGDDQYNTLDKSKAIYDYVKSNFTCSNRNYEYISTTLDDVVKREGGSVGDINMLLIAMLRKKGIHADPVLLSTREYGYNPAQYFFTDRLNYLICSVKINNKIYYLDASQPELGFGKLDYNCYNGHARIMCDKDSGSVYFLSDSIKEAKSTTVFIVNDEKGNGVMGGSYESVPGYYGSYNIRQKIAKDGEAEFFKKIELSNISDLKLENTGIDSLKLYDEPIKIHYEFSYKNTADDVIYFSPMMDEGFKENPFKAAERKYPVEMFYPIDQIYNLSAEIPAGYIVDEIPKSVKVGFNGSEGFFEYIIQKSETNIQLRCHLKLNKAFFLPDDYNSLRDFFAFVVKKEGEQIVFKKKK